MAAGWVLGGVTVAEHVYEFTRSWSRCPDAHERPWLCAIGDVTKPPMLAHKTWAEAATVVGAIAQDAAVALDYSNVPAVTTVIRERDSRRAVRGASRDAHRRSARE